MNNYIQIEFWNISPQQSEILVALLNEAGFEGFEESERFVKAYIPEKKFTPEPLNEAASILKLSYSKKLIEETNWNHLWESSFEPVIIDDFVAIRADFHKPVNTVQFEILITPKMSFGTGHHATTYLMLQQMRNINFKDKTVFDFGTGTGVLSILSEKLGARKTLAIDNDRWSIENAAENFKKNKCTSINLEFKECVTSDSQFDIILANINRNVIMANLFLLTSQLSKEGLLLVSGIISDDEYIVISESEKTGLKIKGKATRDNWLFLMFSKV